MNKETPAESVTLERRIAAVKESISHALKSLPYCDGQDYYKEQGRIRDMQLELDELLKEQENG